MGRLTSQVRALLWKNFLIKKRNKKQLFPELLMPIYFVALLAMIKALLSPETMPPIVSFPSHQVLDQSVFPRAASHVLVSNDSFEVRRVMDLVAAELNLTYTVYPNQAAMEEEYLNTSPNSYGLVFYYDNGVVMDYALRVPFDLAPSSTLMFDVMTGGCRSVDGLGDCMANRYLKSGFAALQLAINTAFIRIQTGKTRLPLPDVSAQLFPKPLYTPDTSYIQMISAIYFVIAYSPFINFLTVNLVTEKEKRIKEGMRMMGLKDSAFWISWFLVYVIIILIVTAIVTGIAEVSNFFLNSNTFIFFLMLFLYGLTIITLSFMLTPFFNKALSAGALASFASMGISLLYLVVSLTRTVTTTGDVDYTIPPAGRWALCLLSPVALALAIDQAIFLDVRHGGMNFSNLTHGTFPLYAPLVMLLLDTVLYGFLAIYFDNVVPSAFGQRRPLWYIFTKSYWCGKAEKSGETTHLITSDHHRYASTVGDSDVEPVAPELLGKEGIRMANLRKVFPGQDGDVVAVDDLTLDMYEGQITGLLGHNGAGKTTLINLLTGLTPASGGKGTVLGLNISDPNSMDKIRPRCGICPQHNILFDRLTPREHLRLYAGIKAMPADEIETAIESSLEDVDLTDRGDTLATELSGGQKRKLSVAIALIGNPKVIILDEPTAGMDPSSRRHLWALLQSRKQGKIILLTTHFMDEADILADRKAIISKGSLRCCGSSFFLKNRFGIGYHLNMVIEPDCSVKSVTDLVVLHVEGATKSRSHGSELSYMLPMSQLSFFPGLFSALEESTRTQTTAMSLGIRSFGVSMTTLEEVFLKLGEDDALADGKPEEKVLTNGAHRSPDNSVEPVQETGKATSESVTRQRFLALVKIRWLLMIRNRMALIFQLFLPVVFVVVGCLVNKYAVPDNSTAAPPSLKMEKALGTYATMKNVHNPVAAPVIVQDSTGGSGSVTLFKMALESVITIREFDESWDLLNVTPHNMGINFTRLEAVTDVLQGYESSFTVLYNDTAIHSLPAAIDMFLNALYGLLLGGVPTTRITTYNLPWNSTEARLEFNNSVFSAAILIAIAFVIIPAGFAVLIVRDRQWKAQSQLRVSGVTWGVYWGSLFTFNMIQYLVPAVLCVVVVLAAQVEALVSGGAILCLIILFLLYLPMNILLSYNFSFAFQNFDTCQSVLPNFFLFYSMLPYVAVVVCDVMGKMDLAEILHYVFCVIDPPYLVFGGIYFIDRMHRIKVLSNKEFELSDYFKFENNIIFVFIMAVVHSLWLYVLLQVLEVKSNGGDPRDVFRRGRNEGTNSHIVPEKNGDVIENEDSDVTAERQRVENLTNLQQNEIHAPVITVKNVRKEFKSREKSKEKKKGFCSRQKKEGVKVAVRNSTFSVNAGEVLGLLGPNGAGKTTTINMIIAEQGLTRGKIEVAGFNIRSSLSEAFQNLGVCPQHDALWETITLREHLNCYAAIRGIPPVQISAAVNSLIESLEVQDHADKHAIKLSGGTKRKLSYAMSLLGQPRVVLMDEPSTGMDPQSKRFLWDTISSNFRGKDRGAILTTHYMEEADVLCSRVAIMVNGQLQCLGPTQHLKDKFGSGYVLEVKVNRGSEVGGDRSEVTTEGQGSVGDKLAHLGRYVRELFPRAVCAETFGDRAQFNIPREDIISLAKTFTALEEAKAKCDLAEYSFSQSTLEQVFLSFAKKQVDDSEATDEERAADNRNVAEMAV